MENFSVLLGKLAENGGHPNLDRPAFRVSSKVAEVMLSLGAALARNAARASSYLAYPFDAHTHQG
jgi:hypothetical protein